MPTLREIAYSLFGSYRLALMDSSGIGHFDPGAAAAIRSFWVAVIILPAYALMVILRYLTGEDQGYLPDMILTEVLVYIISWATYALIMDTISRFLERSERYPLFLSAYNWTSVVQMMIYLPAMILGESGLLPGAVGNFLVFAATLAVLGYQSFTTQVALEIPGFSAAALVLLDLVLSAFISRLAGALY